MTNLLALAEPDDTAQPLRFQPTAPTTLEESGLPHELVLQLVLKTLFFSGELTGSDLAKRLGVVFGVIEPILEFLKAQRHLELTGSAILAGSSHRYRITSEGRGLASLFLQQSHYVGRAPVPLAQYRDYMNAVRNIGLASVTPAEVKAACANLTLSDTVLDEIGSAVNAGRSIFIYGSPGNGKTAIARAIRHLLAGDIAIPHALEIDGSIIRVLDSVSHEERPLARESEGLSLDLSMDHRWATCQRPMVLAGGELTLEALDLTYDRQLGYYKAPLQVVSNGGLLVIDDFGRQRCEPRDLLNRWMVPLENGVDNLTLQSGQKFEIPFFAFVAFATNIRPSQLVDEAFLRRVRYKVFAEDPSPENFATIWRNWCEKRDVAYDATLVEHVLNGYFRAHEVSLRACQPRDLINQALVLANYRGQPRALTAELLDAACVGYFVEERG